MTVAAEPGLWDWAAAAYAAPGVAEACLALQDHHDQNVPLLLWAAWSAETGRRPDADDIKAACDTARAWGDIAIRPLRAVRRALRGAVPDLDTTAREAVREQVKAVELAAERHLLQALEGLAPVISGPQGSALAALVATARVWDRVTPRPALQALASALDSRLGEQASARLPA